MNSYFHDDCGVKCRFNPKDKTDIQPVEPHCLNCGVPEDGCDCGNYECGWYFEEGEEDEDSDSDDVLVVEGLREKIDRRKTRKLNIYNAIHPKHPIQIPEGKIIGSQN